METLIVRSKNKKDLLLIASLLERMKVQARLLSEEDQEDYYLVQLMKQADRSKKVSVEEVMKKLTTNES